MKEENIGEVKVGVDLLPPIEVVPVIDIEVDRGNVDPGLIIEEIITIIIIIDLLIEDIVVVVADQEVQVILQVPVAIDHEIEGEVYQEKDIIDDRNEKVLKGNENLFLLFLMNHFEIVTSHPIVNLLKKIKKIKKKKKKMNTITVHLQLQDPIDLLQFVHKIRPCKVLYLTWMNWTFLLQIICKMEKSFFQFL